MAFLVICTGIFILQMSKVDPRKLANVSELRYTYSQCLQLDLE